MAAENKRSGLSESVQSLTCTKCVSDGKETKADLYCVICDESYCLKCKTHHERAFKTHKLIDTNALKSDNDHELADFCEEHPNSILLMYCEAHDAVCCTRCIPEFHQYCIGVDTVYHCSSENVQTDQKNETITVLSKKIKEVKEMTASKSNELSVLCHKRDNIMKEVQDFKRQIIEKIEEIERTSVRQIQLKHHEATDKISEDITMLNKMLKSMELKLAAITQGKGDNQAQLFIHIKQGHNLASNCSHMVAQAEKDKPLEYAFNFNHDIQYLLDGIKSFGEIENIDQQEYNMLSFVDHNIEVRAHDSKDKVTCSVNHVYELENGNIVLTDIRNQKLKEFDSAYHMLDTIDLLGKPFGVCQTGSSEVAVTLCTYQQVQFVSLDNKMTKTRSFTIYEKCRGICYSQQELFISCGGSEHESVGQIKVYSINGKLLRSFQTDQSGENLFSLPVHIVVSNDGSTLYVADRDNGLVILTRCGLKRAVTSDSKLLKGAQGVCVDSSDQIFVSCSTSHNIVQLDKHGRIVKEVIRYWLKSPVSINYLRNQKRLVLTFHDWNKIRAFHLLPHLHEEG